MALAAAKTVLDLLFPPLCIGCRAPVAVSGQQETDYQSPQLSLPEDIQVLDGLLGRDCGGV
jgi:hypothetical protein